MARFNFGYDDKLVGLGRPVQEVQDTPCLNCGDEYSERELLSGRCFECRLDRQRKGYRLEIRPSFTGASELDFKPRGV